MANPKTKSGMGTPETNADFGTSRLQPSPYRSLLRIGSLSRLTMSRSGSCSSLGQLHRTSMYLAPDHLLWIATRVFPAFNFQLSRPCPCSPRTDLSVSENSQTVPVLASEIGSSSAVPAAGWPASGRIPAQAMINALRMPIGLLPRPVVILVSRTTVASRVVISRIHPAAPPRPTTCTDTSAPPVLADCHGPPAPGRLSSAWHQKQGLAMISSP